MASDEQQIKQIMEEWRRRTAEGDVEGLLSLTADHAVFLTPGNPPITKTAFAEGFRRISAKARIEPRQQLKDLGICDDLAYAWSHLTVVLTVFRKNAAGTWQLARDANLIAAAGSPERA